MSSDVSHIPLSPRACVAVLLSRVASPLDQHRPAQGKPSMPICAPIIWRSWRGRTHPETTLLDPKVCTRPNKTRSMRPDRYAMAR